MLSKGSRIDVWSESMIGNLAGEEAQLQGKLRCNPSRAVAYV
jgi:hypothetical protein